MNDDLRRRAPTGPSIALIAVALSLVAAVLLLGPFRSNGRAGRAQTAREGGRETETISISPAAELESELETLEGVASYLRRQLRTGIDLTEQQGQDSGIEGLAASRTDVAILPPLGCVHALERAGSLQILVTQSRGSSTSAFGVDSTLLVRRDDALESPNDLSQARLCVTSRRGSASLVAAHAWLRGHGITPDEAFLGGPVESGSIDRAVADLTSGVCDVAALPMVDRTAPEGTSVLALTGHVPTPCWVAGPGLSDRARRALRDALAGFDGQRDLNTMVAPSFRHADSSTYRGLRLIARLEGFVATP